MLTIAVDVGGTFTDLVVVDSHSSRKIVHKVPSTPPNFGEGFMRGVSEALALFNEHAPEPKAVTRVVHGTTVATNTILTQSGAKLGFMLTDGCRDILYIGLGWRPKMYDLNMDPVEPLFLAPRRRSLEVRERMDARGNVVTPLDEDHVRDVAKALVDDHTVEAIVVCYLHAYANPAHERRTREILQECYPYMPITLSSDVLPRRREYRRLVVAGFDAYVKPVVTSYLKELTASLQDSGIRSPLRVMQSHGGVGGADTVIERPIGTVLSGLAAGVIGAAEAARVAGIESAISLDMGGTSADVALIREGRPIVTMQGSFEDYPLHIPMVDVRTIGAGGSSIAYVDEGGALKVGPQSAGANPGPVCYGRGGTQPTVTDASFVLGYLNPATFAGGLKLDVERSLEAIRTRIAEPLGMDPIEAALGIHRIVNSNMAQTIRLVSIKRGFDPREFALIPCGGAGPVHAGPLAEDVHIKSILVPPSPGVLSAMGLLLAPVQHEAMASFEYNAETADPVLLKSTLAELDSICHEKMLADQVDFSSVTTEYWADMRYVGQAHELQIRLPSTLDDSAIRLAVKSFHEMHEKTYSHANLKEAVEFVVVRSVHRESPDTTSLTPGLATKARKLEPTGTRHACFSIARGFESVPVYDRYGLAQGDTLRGPAIIEQRDTTTVLYPDHECSVDVHGNLLVRVPVRS